MKRILTVWKKELKDTIRDRRTLMSMIVMPMVLMPALILGIGKFTDAQQKKIENQTIKIGMNSTASEFAGFLSRQDKLQVLEIGSASPKDAIKSGKADIVAVIPDNYQNSLDAQQNVPVEVYRDSTVVASSAALSRFSAAVASYNAGVQGRRFAGRGIDQSILNGLSIVPQDVASEQQRGGFGLGLLLPLFIVMWSVIGGQYTAIDVSAGEKERRTLESLLLTPVKRLELVLGKFLAVATAATTSVVISLLSFYVALTFGFSKTLTAATGNAGAANFSISVGTILLLLGVSLLLVIMFSAVLLSIGIFAKNFKEAQSYIGPAYLIVVLPITILNIIPNFKPALWFFALPVANALALFKELLVGTTDWGHIAITFASLAVYSGLAILITTKIYQQEKVLVTN
ncbi:MAG: ABC transporter permease [Candidatus Saccharibacteria bacterium]